jgi:chromatin remodeling complex protein RSC6
MSQITSSDNTKMSATAKPATKKSAKAEVAAVAVAVAAPAAVAAAPVVAKAPKAKKAAAAEAEVAPVAAAASVVAPSPAESAVSAVDEDVSVTLSKAIERQLEIGAQQKSLAAEAAANLKAIEKLSARLAKKAERKQKRKAAIVEGAEPKPCIFTKPVKISSELCSFLGKPKDTEVSRSAVTKGVMAYARANNLMDKQTIKADAALRKLLTLNEGDSLTILNLQKFLRRHYIKAAPVVA